MNKRILIVDDHPTNLKLASVVLEDAGYEVAKAADAQEALKEISQNPPALILMDIALPGMDGLSLTRQLKADASTNHIKIIAMTAFAMKGDDAKAFAAGCDGYLSKPIETRKLADQVREFIARGPAES